MKTTLPRLGVLPILATLLSIFLPAVVAQDSPQDGAIKQSWMTQAEALITELSRLDLKPTKIITLEPSREVTRAEEILWELWLTTGMPPLLLGEGKLSLQTYVRNNVIAYQQYLVTHSNLKFEELQRLGLTNTIDAYGSPLWYMTLKYLTVRASVTSTIQINIHTTPKVLLVESPLSDEAYSTLSAEMARWLKNNEKELDWDVNAKKFRPRSGAYIGTDELYGSRMEYSLFYRRNRLPASEKSPNSDH